jgi:hypothetical protein
MPSTQSRYQFVISNLKHTQEDSKRHSSTRRSNSSRKKIIIIKKDRSPRKTNETSCHPLKPGPPEMAPLVPPSPLKKCLPFESPGDSDLLVVPFRGCQPPLLQRDLDTRNAGHHARAEHQIASGHTRLSQ